MTIFNGERLETELFQLVRKRMAADFYQIVSVREPKMILQVMCSR
jgi:hypothetical protein